MARIFISYKRVDKDKVFKIKDQIESALGEKCWIDLDGIESGNFALQTLNAIEEAAVVLFFYSNASETSQCQRRELEYAIQQDKRIIPVLFDKMPADSWYYHHLAEYHAVRAEDALKLTSIIKDIVLAIGDDHNHYCSENALRGPQSPCPHPEKSKKTGCVRVALALFLILVIVSQWMLFSPSSSNSQKESSSIPSPPHSEYVEDSPADTMVCDSVVAEYEDETVQGTGRVDNDNAVEVKIDDGINYEEKFDFKDIASLSSSELELESLRIQYIIDSLKVERNTEQALYHCHKYQYLLQKELYKKHQIENESSSMEYEEYDEEETETFNYLWLLLILPLLFAGYYAFRRRGLESGIQNTKKVAMPSVNSRLPLFSKRTEIKIFIAGSTRLVAERDALRSTISKMYNQHKSDNLVVEAYEFDDFTREYVEGGQQKLYDDFIRNEADWVVFITDGTIGDKTIWELENAIKVHKETGHPKILMYSIPQNITTAQEEQMSQFKSILNREDNYWIDYEDVNTIRSTFREHLEWDLINLMKQEMRRGG